MCVIYEESTCKLQLISSKHIHVGLQYHMAEKLVRLTYIPDCILVFVLDGFYETIL